MRGHNFSEEQDEINKNDVSYWAKKADYYQQLLRKLEEGSSGFEEELAHYSAELGISQMNIGRLERQFQQDVDSPNQCSGLSPSIIDKQTNFVELYQLAQQYPGFNEQQQAHFIALFINCVEFQFSKVVSLAVHHLEGYVLIGLSATLDQSMDRSCHGGLPVNDFYFHFVEGSVPTQIELSDFLSLLPVPALGELSEVEDFGRLTIFKAPGSTPPEIAGYPCLNINDSGVMGSDGEQADCSDEFTHTTCG